MVRRQLYAVLGRRLVKTIVVHWIKFAAAVTVSATVVTIIKPVATTKLCTVWTRNNAVVTELENCVITTKPAAKEPMAKPAVIVMRAAVKGNVTI